MMHRFAHRTAWPAHLPTDAAAIRSASQASNRAQRSTAPMPGAIFPSTLTLENPAPMFSQVLAQSLALHGGGLDPRIARRFGKAKLRFAGTMSQVYCSLIGALFATLLRPLHLLPARCASDVHFVFRIESTGAGFTKERRYRFADGSEFVFRSLFVATPQPQEEFPLGCAMVLRLETQADGALLFASDGYRIQFAGWSVRLPVWLVARFELLHQSIDEDRFQVLLRVSHALLGTLFYQRGEFAPAAD